jgi:hypothetical protein
MVSEGNGVTPQQVKQEWRQNEKVSGTKQRKVKKVSDTIKS